ncbi:MAG: hypothetical protein ACFFHD_14185 [Promethearchaeota archaeon]
MLISAPVLPKIRFSNFFTFIIYINYFFSFLTYYIMYTIQIFLQFK